MSLLKNKLDKTPVKTNKYDSPYKGIVVDNDDPKKLGRVKCTIEGIFDNIDTESLPWIAPWNPSGLGGGDNLSFFSVPNIDSELIIEFPYKNPYAIFYTGYWQSEKTHQTLFDENYPKRYGWVDELDNYWFVDREEEHIKFHHSSGTRIEIFKDGNVQIETQDKVEIDIHGDCTAQIDGDLSCQVDQNTNISTDGNTKISSKGWIELSSNTKINLNAPIVNVSNFGSATTGAWYGILHHIGTHIHEGNKQHTGNVNQTGNYILSGVLTALSNAIIGGIYFLTHRHTGVHPGSGTSDGPVN